MNKYFVITKWDKDGLRYLHPLFGWFQDPSLASWYYNFNDAAKIVRQKNYNFETVVSTYTEDELRFRTRHLKALGDNRVELPD